MLDTQALLQRPHYAEHARAEFDATLVDTACTRAAEYLAPHNHKGNANEQTFDGEKVTLIPETKAARDALARTGFYAEHHDAEDGGLGTRNDVTLAGAAQMNHRNTISTILSFGEKEGSVSYLVYEANTRMA
ncbi:hypothetical protein [Pseudomonas aeruginosa]|uniref:hypothetical protein n=1 Tax=Pseudomonas aeruginosa TaxID=287 RepID=UPI00350E5A27